MKNGIFKSLKAFYRSAALIFAGIAALLISMTAYAALPASALKAEDVPSYSGSPYVEITGNVPGFALSDLITDEYVSFGAPDSLGRTTGSSACLGPGTLPRTDRGAIGTEIRPTGFQLDKYPDLIESPGFLYNRCHVIGFQLCGDNGSPENLFTGTRYLNVTGMLPFESQIASCIGGTGYHVIYRATPIYRGNNLVADGIQLEAFSVEDGGRFVRFNVFVYNVQPGVVIDYATGKNEADPNYTAAASSTGTAAASSTGTAASAASAASSFIPLDTGESQSEAAVVTRGQEASAADPVTADYILNINTRKFHYPWCSSVNSMKEKNKKAFNGSRDEAVNAGYVPCKKCCP